MAEGMSTPGKAEYDHMEWLSITPILEAFALHGQDIRTYSPLTLAYLGDSVYDVVVRSVLVLSGNCPVNQLHRLATRYVKAGAQARVIKALTPILTHEEQAVCQRGRNAHSPTRAKNASVEDYRYATGFEALIGYLALRGESARLLELVKKGMEEIDRSS